MNLPSDPHRGYSDETRRSRTTTVQRHSQHVRQTQYPASASREISQVPQSLPQMQPHVTDGRTYLVQGHQDISARQDIQGYAPSTIWAYQGSGLQQYDDPIDAQGRVTLPGGHRPFDDPIDAQGRVTLPGGHRPFDDPHRRTAHFVDSGQHPGTRYASYAGDTEQRAITSAARAITHFEMQFTHGANLNASAQDVLQGGTPWPYPQRIDPNYRGHPPAVECANHNGKSSRTRRW
ncbi:hypothetical protein EDB82DRAFT_480972 [Fusarium venenatum]|uniref:uncharacterized protein n=1 Tax=Fusarium venenatum TaxID=56646 RepID=UPI001DA664B4|nr:hypothetical protein EDB82DRAFT_480972 [Fusarium venenatum]